MKNNNVSNVEVNDVSDININDVSDTEKLIEPAPSEGSIGIATFEF